MILFNLLIIAPLFILNDSVFLAKISQKNFENHPGHLVVVGLRGRSGVASHADDIVQLFHEGVQAQRIGVQVFLGHALRQPALTSIDQG